MGCLEFGSKVKNSLKDCKYVGIVFPSGRRDIMKYCNFVSDFNEYDLWECITTFSISYDKNIGYVGVVYLGD